MSAPPTDAKDWLGDPIAQRWLAMVDETQPFKPMAYYDADGDCIEFLFANDSYWAERIDDRLTVYYSRETNQIIGSLIKGVRRLLREITADCPGFVIEVQDGKVRLKHLISAALWSKDDRIDRMRGVTYQKLRDAADEAEVEVQLPALA